jgi:hypothetical protein
LGHVLSTRDEVDEIDALYRFRISEQATLDDDFPMLKVSFD